MGAVYNNTDIALQSTVAIKENTGVNLYLDQDASVVVDRCADRFFHL